MKITLNDRDSVLIWLYVEIDQLYTQTDLFSYTERLSNNATPFFSDVELLTCAVFAELLKQRTRKWGYAYIKDHYAAWFPTLPCYEVYNRKLNKLHEAFAYIFSMLKTKYGEADQAIAMIDTEPIEVCQQQHSHDAKAARPFVSKGYCAAKKQYYVGAKLQIIAQGRAHQLPFPGEYFLATASVHDLDIAQTTLPDSDLKFIALYGDKAYIDKSFQLELFANHGIALKTPHKKKKGQKHLRLFQQAENSIHASIRQPIDALFAWINDQTAIQNASKVRSMSGLFLHVHLKMLAALILLIVEF
ncbi:IS982 family transposase [candidate division KSB1 bacterium]|nr:IS982 family transposase [candidate division KSB1 bacterium]